MNKIKNVIFYIIYIMIDKFTFKWKCNNIIISPSQGWKNAFLILLYKMSTLSPLTELYLNPLEWASKVPKENTL